MVERNMSHAAKRGMAALSGSKTTSRAKGLRRNLGGLCVYPCATWETLRQSGSRLARPAYSRAMREVVAKRIMEMAQRGVQDRDELVADALRFVTANYEEPSKLKN